MRRVLIDTSIWIAFFRGNPIAERVLDLLDSGEIVTNDLILAELLPSIVQRRETELHELLLSVKKVRLSVDWPGVIAMQTANLRQGNNNLGIPDLIIAQNAIDHGLVLFENDRHFRIMKDMFGLELLSR